MIYAAQFQLRLLRAEAAGLNGYWAKTREVVDAQRYIRPAHKKHSGLDEGKPLSLQHMSSIFVVLAAGSLLSLVILLLEIALAKLREISLTLQF